MLSDVAFILVNLSFFGGSDPSIGLNMIFFSLNQSFGQVFQMSENSPKHLLSDQYSTPHMEFKIKLNNTETYRKKQEKLTVMMLRHFGLPVTQTII